MQQLQTQGGQMDGVIVDARVQEAETGAREPGTVIQGQRSQDFQCGFIVGAQDMTGVLTEQGVVDVVRNLVESAQEQDVPDWRIRYVAGVLAGWISREAVGTH